MKEKLMKLEDAVELVEDCFSIGFGGFMFFRRPMAFIRALIKAGKRDLNAYSINANIDLDMLIGAGCVQSVHYSYPTPILAWVSSAWLPTLGEPLRTRRLR
ncbi:MAG: CoA-transferase [Candidatus Freyrarchaeum guaymaensis]|nr:CoA-transferase [Candidatus Sigynarchaeota archaeon]